MTTPKPSASMRAAWRECPRKVFHRYVAGLEPVRVSPALSFGAAYHAGLEELRRSGDVDKAARVAAGAAAVAGGGELESVQLGVYLRGYAANFRDDEIVSVEASVFDQDDSETGFADAIVRLGGDLWVVEDKTTSIWVDTVTMAHALKQSDQIATYVDGLRTRGIPVVGCLYRQVKKTATRPRKDEDLIAYRLRLASDYGDGADTYREIPVTFSDRETQMAKAHRFATNLEIAEQFDEIAFEAWPWTASACLNRFGSCEYLHLCATGADHTDRAFRPGKDPLDDGRFQRKIWNLEDDTRREKADGPADADVFGGR